jgi:hypothetical protein
MNEDSRQEGYVLSHEDQERQKETTMSIEKSLSLLFSSASPSDFLYFRHSHSLSTFAAKLTLHSLVTLEVSFEITVLFYSHFSQKDVLLWVIL